MYLDASSNTSAHAAQRVVAVYEAKQAEVLREAAGLRAALDHLQKEHRALINQQVRLPVPSPFPTCHASGYFSYAAL